MLHGMKEMLRGMKNLLREEKCLYIYNVYLCGVNGAGVVVFEYLS